MTDWDKMDEAMREFRKATDKIKEEVREQISVERKIAPMYDPARIIEWMINDETDYASVSDRYAAAKRHFPIVTTIEFNEAAAFIRLMLKGKDE